MLFSINRENNKIVFLITLLLFINSCATVSNKNTFRYSDRNSDIKSSVKKIYQMKNYQDYELEQKFYMIVSVAYKKAVERFMGVKFTYTINPDGAVYPFSKLKIECVVDKKVSEYKALDVCNFFFDTLDYLYEREIKKELTDENI